jgi:hypothetical protein
MKKLLIAVVSERRLPRIRSTLKVLVFPHRNEYPGRPTFLGRRPASRIKRLAQRGTRVSLVLLAVVTVAAGLGLTASPAKATTWINHTNCRIIATFPVLPGFNGDYVCLHAGDWYTGTAVGNSWEWPQCSISALDSWALHCGDNHMGHYWNSSIHANTDWLHYTIDTAFTFPYTTWGLRYCMNMNTNRTPTGTMWESDSEYEIYPWQNC